MKVYLNSSFYTVVFPVEVLLALEKPQYLIPYYRREEKKLCFMIEESDSKYAIDVPQETYSGEYKGLKILGQEFGFELCRDMKWSRTRNQMEAQPRLVTDSKGRIGILILLEEAVSSSEKINWQEYVLPHKQENLFDEEDDEILDGEEDDEDQE